MVDAKSKLKLILYVSFLVLSMYNKHSLNIFIRINVHDGAVH